MMIDAAVCTADGTRVFTLVWGYESRELKLDLDRLLFFDDVVPVHHEFMDDPLADLFGVKYDGDGQLEFVWECIGRQFARPTPAAR